MFSEADSNAAASDSEELDESPQITQTMSASLTVNSPLQLENFDKNKPGPSSTGTENNFLIPPLHISFVPTATNRFSNIETITQHERQ